jgi:SAM-dependent methyltransferase
VDAQPTTAESSPFDDGELYDALLTGFTHGVDFYVELARQAKGPVLDLACGTGRVLLPCMQAGADVDGLDLSEAMLSTLRRKADALHLAPRLYTADMSDFRLPRRYALITMACNSFVHNLTQEAQLRCLERCRQHLLPGGLMAFDTFFPDLGIIGAPQNTRVLELETKHPVTGATFRAYDTRRFDRVEQIQHSLNELELIGEDGSATTVQRSETRMRWIYKGEMALLLRVAGFARWEIYADFDRRPLTRETDGMIVCAWAAGDGGGGT